MKRLIVFLALYLTISGFSQNDSIDIKCNILNHSTSPVILYNTSVKYSGNKIILKLSGKSKIESIIKNVCFALYFYENRISIIGTEKFTYYTHIYPEKDFNLKTVLIPSISPEQIEQITIFPLKVNYSINLQWSLNSIIEEQQIKFASKIRENMKEDDKGKIITDTTVTITEAQYSINAHQDKTRYKKAEIKEPAIDTVKAEQAFFDTVRTEEITAGNIEENKYDSILVLTNIVTEVFDEEVIVSLGENFIDKKKKYLIVREKNRIQERIALAEPVEIQKTKSRMKLIYYYTKNEPQAGDLFYEYIELREKFNLFKFVKKHKTEGFLGLGCISAVMSYIYDRKSNDSFNQYKDALNTNDAKKYREETEDFEKTRNIYLYSAAFCTVTAVITYVYDKFLNRNKNSEKEYSKIETYFQANKNFLLGVKLRY